MLPVTPIGTPLIHLGTVDSSNNYAMAQAQAQLAGHGAAWLARHQTAGRGQRGRQWQAEPGQNIAFSTLLEPKGLTIAQQFHLSLTVALAGYDFFSSYAGTHTCIKWPNDIYWKDRKAGGILIENVLQGNEWRFAIAGIGININQLGFDPLLPNPVSLGQITGRQYDVPGLAIQLCHHLENRWQQLMHGKVEALLETYNQILFKKGDIAKLKIGDTIVKATILGVNAQGQLLIQDNGKNLALTFGSAEWLLD